MDDRFLSRGKAKDSSEWVEGNLVFGNIIIPCTNENMFFPYMRVSDCMTIENGTYITKDSRLKFYIVDPETVGGCIGLTDKNDELIFEGDIIKHYVKNSDIINIYVVEWEKRLTKFVGRYKGDEYYGEKYAYAELHEKMIYEVIGNIYDNPELFESEVVQCD